MWRNKGVCTLCKNVVTLESVWACRLFTREDDDLIERDSSIILLAHELPSHVCVVSVCECARARVYDARRETSALVATIEGSHVSSLIFSFTRVIYLFLFTPAIHFTVDLLDARSACRRGISESHFYSQFTLFYAKTISFFSLFFSTFLFTFNSRHSRIRRRRKFHILWWGLHDSTRIIGLACAMGIIFLPFYSVRTRSVPEHPKVANREFHLDVAKIPNEKAAIFVPNYFLDLHNICGNLNTHVYETHCTKVQQRDLRTWEQRLFYRSIDKNYSIGMTWPLEGPPSRIARFSPGREYSLLWRERMVHRRCWLLNTCAKYTSHTNTHTDLWRDP